MFLTRTDHTISLIDIREKVLKDSHGLIPDLIISKRAKAVLITMNKIPGFWSEYLLTQFMKAKGFGEVHFSFARHVNLAIFMGEIVMYASSPYRMADVIETWIREFGGFIQILQDVNLPLGDMCSPFHFATLGPGRISVNNMKRPDLFKDPSEYLLFVQPVFDGQSWVNHVPGYCLIDGPWAIEPKDWEYFFYFETKNTPRKARHDNKLVTLKDYPVGFVRKYHKMRASNERVSINNYSRYQYTFVQSSELTRDQLKVYDEIGIDLNRITSPMDRWEYLDMRFPASGYAIYQLELPAINDGREEDVIKRQKVIYEDI